VRESFVVDSEILGESLAVGGFVGVRFEREKGRTRFDEEALLGLRISCPKPEESLFRVVRRRSLSNECKPFAE